MDLEKNNQRLEDYYIKKGFVTNPVMTYNSTDEEEYWTDARIRTSEVFQFQIYSFARKLFQRRGLRSVVDIGSGPGIKAMNAFAGIAETICLVDQPNTERIIRRLFPGTKFTGCNLDKDVLNLDQKFGMVISCDVIEHLSNPDTLLESIRSSLNDNGIALISTPERDLRRGEDCMQSPNKQHVREWNSSELSAYISSKGFKVIDHQLFPLKKFDPMEGLAYSLSKPFKRMNESTWYGNQVLLFSL